MEAKIKGGDTLRTVNGPVVAGGSTSIGVPSWTTGNQPLMAMASEPLMGIINH